MAAKCRFCGRSFESAQGVRAHLKSCAAYQDRPEKAAKADLPRQHGAGSGSLGSLSLGTDDDPESDDLAVRQLKQQLAAERVRLQLREVEEAHAELDRKAQAKAYERKRVREQELEEARASERVRESERRAQEESLLATERRETEQHARAEKRRNTIQEVKRQAVECWFGGFFMPSDFKPNVCLAIERELQTLPVEDMPVPELVQLAEGIRDRMERKARAKTERTNSLVQQRQRLIQHGTDYAERELRNAEGLDVLERWRIENAVKSDLETIAGTESLSDIEDQVEGILEREGFGYDEEDE